MLCIILTIFIWNLNDFSYNFFWYLQVGPFQLWPSIIEHFCGLLLLAGNHIKLTSFMLIKSKLTSFLLSLYMLPTLTNSLFMMVSFVWCFSLFCQVLYWYPFGCKSYVHKYYNFYNTFGRKLFPPKQKRIKKKFYIRYLEIYAWIWLCNEPSFENANTISYKISDSFGIDCMSIHHNVSNYFRLCLDWRADMSQENEKE